MSRYDGRRVQRSVESYGRGESGRAPGKRTLTEQLPVRVQLDRDGHSGLDDAEVQAAATHGLSAPSGALPHFHAIQASFGPHDVSGVTAHVGGPAETASRAMGARAYATGDHVAFAAPPDLFLAAHEAAHVVQQRSGVHLSSAVGEAGDAYERHADAVAARVVAGESAADLLGPVGGHANTAVQRDVDPGAKTADAAGPRTVTTGSRMAENSYRRMFHNQRAGLTRLGAALKKDSTPKKSLLGEIAGGVVGGAIGALLGPVGTAAASLVKQKIIQKAIEKLADAVKDKATEIGKDAAKAKFQGAHKTDEADNFVEAQSLAINDAEHGAVQELLRHTDEIEGTEGGPAGLATLADQIDTRATIANDLQVAQSAGAWANATAEKDRGKSAAWADQVAGGGAVKGALEIDLAYDPARGRTITGANWRGVGRETEEVVREHGSVPISMLGVTLRVTVNVPGWGEGRFEVSPGGDIILPKASTYLQAIHVAAGSSVSGVGMTDLEKYAVNAARFIVYHINQMKVADLKFDE